MKNKKLLVFSLAALMATSITVAGCSKKGSNVSGSGSEVSEVETDEDKVERVKAEIGPNYQSLAGGVKRDFELLTELDGVQLTYSFENTQFVNVNTEGNMAVVNSVYYGDKDPLDSTGEAVVTDEWSTSTVMTVTLTCGEVTATKKFNVKILPCARVMDWDTYIAAEKSSAACVQVIIDRVEVETKYNYNIAWGHDKNNHSYYFYNFADKYLTDTKIAVGNEVIISGTKDIYNGFHELIKFDAVELVEQNSTHTIERKDITSDLESAASLSDKSLTKYQGAPVKVTDFVIKSITAITTDNYITASDTVKHDYLNKVYVKGTVGTKNLTIEISRVMDGAQGKAKLESLAPNDIISIEGMGAWYNEFQVTALDADKIVKTGVKTVTDEEKLQLAKEEVEGKLPTAELTDDVELPVTTTAYGATVTWAVSGEGATLNADGKTLNITRASSAQQITITGTISIAGITTTATVEKTLTIAKSSSSPLQDVRTELQNASSGAISATAYTTYGKVTAVDGNSFYYDDGYSSMMVYNYSSYKATVGDNVQVVATFQNYKGLIETKAITSVTKVDTVYTPRSAYVVNTEVDFTKEKLLGEDSRLITFTSNLKFKAVSQAYVSGSKDGRYTFTLGSTDITVSISRFNADVEAITTLITSLAVGDEITIQNAIVGWFNGPQITLTSASQIAKVAVTE